MNSHKTPIKWYILELNKYYIYIDFKLWWTKVCGLGIWTIPSRTVLEEIIKNLLKDPWHKKIIQTVLYKELYLSWEQWYPRMTYSPPTDTYEFWWQFDNAGSEYWDPENNNKYLTRFSSLSYYNTVKLFYFYYKTYIEFIEEYETNEKKTKEYEDLKEIFPKLEEKWLKIKEEDDNPEPIIIEE